MHSGLLVFGVTYVLISAGRLGKWRLPRALVALLGALLAVGALAISPQQALRSIDIPTLVLLGSVMGMGSFLELDGFFERCAAAAVYHAGSPGRLLAILVWGSGLLSALVTNDAVCVLLAPLVVEWIRKYNLPRLPFLLALATSANTGSVATLVGNPQNMLCASLGSLRFLPFLLHVGPIAILGLVLNHAVLLWVFRNDLRSPRIEPAPATTERLFTPSSVWTLLVIAGTVLVYARGGKMSLTALGGFALLLLTQRRSPVEVAKRIDASLLIFFAGLFVVVEAFVASGAPAQFFAHVPVIAGGTTPHLGDDLRTSALFLFGSNVVTNVPFIMIVRNQISEAPHPTAAWELLALASTFAGNLTLLGSVANVIVAEKSRAIGEIRFLDYAKVGTPVALLTTLAGTVWLWLLRP